MQIRIKEIMIEQNVSSVSLAKKTGVSKVTINNLINNKTVPSIHTLEKVANALSVPMWHFFVSPKDVSEESELTALIQHKGDFYKATTIEELEKITEKIGNPSLFVTKEQIDKNICDYSKFLEEIRSFIIDTDNMYTEIDKLCRIITNSPADDSYKDAKINLYILALYSIAILDTSVSIKHFLSSKNKWEKNYFAKKICLTIHETLNTYNNYNKVLFQDSRKVNLHYKLQHFSKKLKTFKNTYENILSQVRNKSEGHIDTKFETYYDSMELLKNMDIRELYNRFIKLMNGLIKIHYQINKKVVSIESRELEKNWMEIITEIYKTKPEH